jgi:hypothetical protein
MRPLVPEGNWRTVLAESVRAEVAARRGRSDARERELESCLRSILAEPAAGDVSRHEMLQRMARVYERWQDGERAAAYRARLAAEIAAAGGATSLAGASAGRSRR